jgi:long-subunit fatty acid transport protein
MKSGIFNFLTKPALAIASCFCCITANAQEDTGFWGHVQYGGSFVLSFGSGYTDITLAPGAIYRFNDYVAAGVGLQGTYVDQKNYFSNFMYGASTIVLLNPIPELQISAEVEELRVNLDVDDIPGQLSNYHRDFWNTGLFLGLGYSMENVTAGVRYNVFFDKKDFVYSDAFMPFIRVYF